MKYIHKSLIVLIFSLIILIPDNGIPTAANEIGGFITIALIIYIVSLILSGIVYFFYWTRKNKDAYDEKLVFGFCVAIVSLFHYYKLWTLAP